MKRCCISIAGVLASLLIASAAVAASVSGSYEGSTSQHKALQLVLRYRRARYFATVVTTLTFRCPRKVVTQPAGFSDNPVTRRGSKYTVSGGGQGYLYSYTWTIKGKRLMGMASASYPVSLASAAAGFCRTGKVSFSASR